MLAAGALLLAFPGCSKSNTPPSAPAQVPASESPALTQEQIAAEVARQVAEQLAAAGVKETSQSPAKEAALDGAAETAAELSPSRAVENKAADKPHVWKIGGAAPNGGLVYFAQDGEFYEAMAPANTVGSNDSLPAGWSAPDMEDLGLIYAGLQKTGAADYGNVYYYSVSKSGGKNRFLRMSDGKEAAGVTVGRKVGVRKFDPAQPPAQFDKAVLVYTPSAAEKAAANTAAPAPAATAAQAPSPAQAGSSTPAKPAPAPAPAVKAYTIGDTGPRGGIVFSASGGKYKEITKPENARAKPWFPEPAGWRVPTMPELMQVYEALHTKVDFGDTYYYSSSVRRSGHNDPDYSRPHASLFPGQSDYDRAGLLFPDASFILAAGGIPMDYFIRFTDGRIRLGVFEEFWYFTDSYPDDDAKGVSLDNAKCLYVRDF